MVLRARAHPDGQECTATMRHNARGNERELCPVIICNLDFIITRWCIDAYIATADARRTQVDAFSYR